MGKYFIPILPGPSPATNQNTVPGPPVPVKLAKTHTLSASDPQGGLLLVWISNTCKPVKENFFEVYQESHSGRGRQERYLGDSNPW